MDKQELKKKAFWAGVSLILAILSIRTVMSLGSGITFAQVRELISSARPLFLISALLGMTGFLFFEGAAVRCMLGPMGYPTSRRKAFLYACADNYFSAITPSATGGQPACALFMMRDGIPLARTTAILLMNSLFYTLAVLLNGLFCMAAGAAMGVLQRFSTFSHILIAIGALTLTGISLFAVLLLGHQSLLWRIANRIFSLLEKLHLMRHPEIRKAKLELLMKQYRECVNLLAEKKKMLIKAFFLNVLQRLSQISVTLSIYMALGGQAKNLFRLYLTQSLCVVGSNCVPIPGSMGVTDYLMVDGFKPMMGADMAYRVELFARSTAFYICMIVSGLVVLAGFICMRAEKKGKQNPPASRPES